MSPGITKCKVMLISKHGTRCRVTSCRKPWQERKSKKKKSTFSNKHFQKKKNQDFLINISKGKKCTRMIINLQMKTGIIYMTKKIE